MTNLARVDQSGTTTTALKARLHMITMHGLELLKCVQMQ